MVTANPRRSRRRLTLVLVASAFALVLATSASAHRSDFRPGKWPSHTVLIGYSSEQALDAALKGRAARVVARVPSLRTVAVRPSADAASFAADVAGARGIDFVQPPALRRPLVEPALTPAAVPGGSYQWQYVLTGADRVPERIARAVSTIRIGIVDSGADLTAGDARLITIKASSQGLFTDFELAAAIAYAVDNGAKIVNLSLGGPRSSQTEVRALEYALTKDVLLVAAAGNSALEGNPVSYPAAHLQPLKSNGVGGYGLSVGASTITGVRADFSNHGSYISLAAPGEEVFGAISKDSSPKHFPRVTLPGSAKGLYGYSSGTSFSAPQVSGAAALVWAANPSLSSRQVADILKQTASGGGHWNPELGFGVINVAAAVEVAAVTPAVSLQAVKYGNAARLSWRGSTRKEKAYRLLSLGANDEEQVVLGSTTEHSHTVQADLGHTYAFVVESLDAAGAVIARSAAALVTLGEAKSALTLTPFTFKERGKRYSLVIAVLATDAPDIKLSSRIIRLEQLLGGKWRHVAYQLTDASGRVIWLVPKGRYTIRAIFLKSSSLKGASSRPLTVSGFSR